MYVKDDIFYAGTMEEGIEVTEAKLLPERMLLVTFSTGEGRLFDTTTLEGSAYKPLDDEEIFWNIVLFHGIITWNDEEIDITPEVVYQDSFPYDEEL